MYHLEIIQLIWMYRVTRKKVYLISVIFNPNYMLKTPKEFDIKKCKFNDAA